MESSRGPAIFRRVGNLPTLCLLLNWRLWGLRFADYDILWCVIQSFALFSINKRMCAFSIGTSISFIGNTPPSIYSQNILVSIDGGTPYETFYSDPSPPSALQWYRSPTLSDGAHTISITHIAGTSVDFMVVTAGPNTPLSGQTVIVDDNDSSITYAGNWASQTGRYKSQDLPTYGLPYGNATHQSGSAGSTATFQFTGSSSLVVVLSSLSNQATQEPPLASTVCLTILTSVIYSSPIHWMPSPSPEITP